MKIRKLLIPVLLFISCIFAFSACSKDDNTGSSKGDNTAGSNGGNSANSYTKFNFDETGTVNLTYNCADEEKNFDAELTAEQSRSFILSLNELSYSEVTDQDITFAPSYDNLMVKVNDETLSLFDVTYIIKYGGYFYFNGKLSKSEDKFSFLDYYLKEYTPKIITESISFGVQYVKQTVNAGENYQIIKSVSQLNDYIATETQNTNLPFVWPDFVLFEDEVINKYDDEYFENSFIVIFMKEASSGSFEFRVNDVGISIDDRLIINYEIYLPSDCGEDIGVTDDMAYWYSFVELSNEYSTINSVKLISAK